MGQSTEELSQDIEVTRQNLTRDVDELSDKVSPSRVIQRRTSAAKGRLDSVRSKVMGTTSSATSGVASAGSSIGDTASGAVDTIEQKAEGNPLTAGMVAFGAGMLISALLPASKPEKQAAQLVMDTAQEHGQPVMDAMKSAGQEMGEELRSSATQAAQEVKETAQQSAEHLKQEGQSSAKTVRNEAPSGS